jgi:hypothetical protein
MRLTTRKTITATRRFSRAVIAHTYQPAMTPQRRDGTRALSCRAPCEKERYRCRVKTKAQSSRTPTSQ